MCGGRIFIMARKLDREPVLFAQGFKHAEGPAFDLAGRLYVTDWRSATIWRISPFGGVEPFARAGGPNGGAFHWNGDYYITDPGANRIARMTPGGEVLTVLDTFENRPLGTPNDLTFHPSGAIYFTEPIGNYTAVPHPPAKAYRIGPEGRVQVVADGLLYPNGVNVDADGGRLFIAESHTGLVQVFEIRGDGSLSNKRVLADMREGQDNLWAPDGMCLDVGGNLYVALAAGGMVRRVTPAGEIDLDIPIPDAFPTNCCFGGPENDELFITEGRQGKVYRVRVGVPGLELFGPRPPRG